MAKETKPKNQLLALLQAQQPTIDNGKLPPQDLEMEEAVLGALLIEKRAWYELEGETPLRPEHFYKDSHRVIFEAITQLIEKRHSVDILTVKNQLVESGNLEIAGGVYYLTELTSRVASAANIKYHARVIIQKYMARELITFSAKLNNLAYSDTEDVFELMENAEARLMEISDMTASASAVLLGDMGDDILSHLQSRAKRMKEKGIVGLPTPLKELDRITLGFQTGLIYLAARTAMGKTTFAIQCAQKTSKSGFPTAFFSIEMSAMQLALKILQSEGKISGDDNKFRTANFNDTEWYIINTQIDLFKKSKLFIDDRTTDIGQICQKLRRLVKKQGVRFAVIDYLQLISSKSTKGNREQEVAHISWKLKMLSKELDIPIMVLAQLNREVDKAPGHVPQLSHLRESGSVEQDADMVLFLLRLRYYGVDVWPDGSSTKDTAQVIIAKQREGPIDDFICGYYGHQATFFDLNSYGGAPDGFTPMSQALRDPSKSKEIVDEETGEIQYPDGRPWENF